MAAVREPWRVVLLAFIILGIASGPIGPVREAAAVSGSTERRSAEALVAAYASHAGAGGRMLDMANDVSFGTSGLHYEEAENALTGRVYVNNALIKGAPPDELANYRRMVTALNDPKIGGMFERGGGHFVLDENKQAYFLVRRFPVATTTADDLIRDMETLQTVGARWTTAWMYQVAMIMHGRQPPPTRPVRLGDRP